MPYLFLAFAFCFNAVANILLKVAATRGFSFASFFHGQWGSPHFIAMGAVAFFGANLVCYLIALEQLPLSIAYPVMIGMTFLITIGAAIMLKEQVTLLRLVGCLLIIGGLVLATRG